MWTILKERSAWEIYKEVLVGQLGLGGSTVDWGSPPGEYPCLVCSHAPPPPPGGTARVYSAFVYLKDARKLIPVQPAGHPEAGGQPDQQDLFNRWMAAQNLTILHFLIETGICKREAFEDRMLEFLGKVDEWRSRGHTDLRKLPAAG